MSCMSVYKVLLEVFPQVDCSVLKAVAVEHENDADIAVLTVLNATNPSLEDHSRPSSPSGGNINLGTRLPISVTADCSNDSIFIEAADSDEQQKGSSAPLPDEGDPRYDDYHAEVHGGLASGVELLEGIIDDAKTNKKILSSAMESVISLMNEVALKEITVEPAKLEASVAGRNLVTALEDLQKRSRLIKEANYILAGEVDRNSAVLATEVEELHLRLQSLSEEKNITLKILREMHGTLLSRLAAIETEKEAAEKERLEKEELSKRSLAEQRLIMASLLQESKILNQKVEENVKLKGFLSKRSQLIDQLHGEFSVISQDVRLLKRKFDQSFPFNNATSCILTSLRSSLKSVATDQANDQSEKSVEQLEVDDKKVTATDQANEAPATSHTHQSEKSLEHLQMSDVVPATSEQQFSNEKMAIDDKKEALEDGWETI